MANNKSLASWIVTAIVILVALAVGWSIWSSLQDTRAKLKAQEEKMKELENERAAVQRFADSLDTVIAGLNERERELVAERQKLENQLKNLRRQYQETLGRLDRLWTADQVNHELDQAFPHWAGQFWEATRSDGVHALIAPRFFGAEVAEIKAEVDKSRKEIALQDSTIKSFGESMLGKDQVIKLLNLKADSLRSTYDNLFAEYQALDKKYRKEVKSHWFKFTPGNVLSAGAGFGAGYVVGKN